MVNYFKDFIFKVHSIKSDSINVRSWMVEYHALNVRDSNMLIVEYWDEYYPMKTYRKIINISSILLILFYYFL